MSNDSETDASRAEQLSALADGELAGAAAAAACAAWGGDPSLRSTWHVYQVIGDVLRSEDLATDPARDAAFLAQVRSRLAAEPVVIAPNLAPLRSRTALSSTDAARRRWGAIWKASTAVAAGFVAVAGIFMLTRAIEPVAPPAGTTLASAGAPGVLTTSASVAGASGAGAESSLAAPETAAITSPAVMDGRLIRDARLDSYLAAHKQFAGSSALGVPSAFLRSATTEASGR